MSNFQCEKCGAVCYESPQGYVSGCEHYPADVKYGCHCDLEPDQMPDECVIGNEGPEWCVFAGEVKSKWQCEYWRPVSG